MIVSRAKPRRIRISKKCSLVILRCRNYGHTLKPFVVATYRVSRLKSLPVAHFPGIYDKIRFATVNFNFCTQIVHKTYMLLQRLHQSSKCNEPITPLVPSFTLEYLRIFG